METKNIAINCFFEDNLLAEFRNSRINKLYAKYEEIISKKGHVDYCSIVKEGCEKTLRCVQKMNF